MFKFIHAADIHLDSPFHGLERYEGAPVERLRGATRRALENLVQLALDEQVRFVLLVGDLYDEDWRDYHTGLFFSAQMSRLREAGIRVFLLAGNHDAASEISRSLRPLEHMHLFSDKQPETVVLDSLDVALHGQGFPERAVTRNLVPAYPAARPGLLNIGLLHTSLSGREGHEPYAPCSLSDLQAKGYDYWALGHVHQQEIVCRDPWIVFPGNSQGRHIRETGPRGCMLVTVDQGRVTAVEPRALDVVRWHRRTVDVSAARDGDTALDLAIADLRALLQDDPERPHAVRLELIGPCRAHTELLRTPARWLNELRAQATDVCAGQVWLEKLVFATRPEVSLEHLLLRDDAYGELLRAIQGLAPGDDLVLELRADFERLKARLPTEAQRKGDWWDLEAPETLLHFRDQVTRLLLPRLVPPAES